MKKLTFLITLAFTIILVDPASAQITEDPQQYHIKTRDGNEFIGTIVLEDDQKIILMTDKFGEITIQKSDILKMELIRPTQIIDGVVWADNPQATRYFFAPNGHGIKRGEGYYQNVWIFFNQFTVGVSDNFSISAGIIPLFLFAGTPTPVWINPKVSIPVVSDIYNIGAGALLGTIIGGESSFGILYGVNTFGNRDRNVTLGLGWGFSDESIASKPTVSIGGMYRTGSNGYVLTENYIINAGNETFGFVSFGGRRIIKNVGLDFGLVVPVSTGINETIAIPWLGLTVPFGHKKEVISDRRF